MTTSRNSLKAAMSGMSGTQAKTTPHVAAVETVPSPSRSARATAPAPSRAGKKAITGHFPPAVTRQLKLIGIETDRSIQSLLEEAINDLFRKHDKSPIA